MLLSGNRLNGELRSDIVKLKDLETLRLFDNELKGLIPKELETLKKLRELNISYNQFNEPISKNLVDKDALNLTMLTSKGKVVLFETI